MSEKFYDATVLGAIANTDYENEISNYGDKIIIRQRPTIAISDYTPDTQLAVQRPNADVVELTIDYAKYFAFVIDDIWDTQSDMDQMSLWAEDASEQMKIVIDTEIMQNVILGAASSTTSGTTAGRKSGDINLGATTSPLALTARDPGAGETEVLDLIISINQALDEENVPENDRWAIIPAWMAAMIKKSELRDASPHPRRLTPPESSTLYQKLSIRLFGHGKLIDKFFVCQSIEPIPLDDSEP